jgi:hypothetical protein
MYVVFSSLPQHFRPRHRLYSSLNCTSRSRLHNFLYLSASAQQQLLRRKPLRFDSGNALFPKLTIRVSNIWLLIMVLPDSQSHICIVVYQPVYHSGLKTCQPQVPFHPAWPRSGVCTFASNYTYLVQSQLWNFGHRDEQAFVTSLYVRCCRVAGLI